MAQAADITARLRAFLSGLPEQKLQLLVQEIDRAREMGVADAGLDIVVDVVRDLTGQAGEAVRQPPAIQHFVFGMLEPFLASDETEATGMVRVREASLGKIWAWLTENPDNSDFQQLLSSVAANQSDAQIPDPESIAKLRTKIVEVIDRALTRLSGKERDRMRFAMLVGGAEGMADLRTVGAVFRLDSQIAEFMDTLPPSPIRLSANVAETLTSSLTEFSRADMVYPLLILMKRLKSPHQLLSILLTHEKTDDGQRLADSPLSAIVTLLLDEIRQSSIRIVSAADRDDSLDGLIGEAQRFARISAAITGGIDLSGVHDWRTQISDHRRETSERLRRTVDKVFPRVRAMMAPLFGHRVSGTHGAVEKHHVVDGVRLLAALRPIRAELAINQVVATAFNDLTTYVDNAGATVAQAIRAMPAADREPHLEAFDAFLEIAELTLGNTYAVTLRRSAKIDEPPAQEPQDDASAA